MVHLTLIARVLDGLILVETWDNMNQSLTPFKTQAKQLLKKLNNGPQKCTIDVSGGNVFHYTIEDGVVYMCLCDTSYPKKLAFAFLEDVHRSFLEELKREFGTQSVDYRSRVETIEKPYYFIKFDRVIQKKKVDYRDPNSSKALSKLNESLTEVSQIMRQNIDDMLRRGESLDEVGRKASDLKFASKEFKGMTNMLMIQALLKQYGVIIAIGLFVMLVIYAKFIRGGGRAPDAELPPPI